MRTDSEDILIPLRDGPSIPLAVIRRLVVLADAGIEMVPEPDGHVSIRPRERLTPDDVQFLTRHRDDVRAAVHYMHHGIACTCPDAPSSRCPWHGAAQPGLFEAAS